MRKSRNQKGFIVSTELMLIVTILVIGLIVGLSAIRTAVVTELADVADAIGSVSQTYSFSGVQGHHAVTSGSEWVDGADTCDENGINNSVSQQGSASHCVSICNVDGGANNAAAENVNNLLPPIVNEP
jgi:hypothetical protein